MKAGNLVFLVTAVALGGWFSREPWRVCREQQAETADAVAEMRITEARYAHDKELEARYSSSVGREELARKQGMRKPNELPLDGTP